MGDESIVRFLQKLQGKLQGLRAAREAYAPLLAPAFNALELLRPDEMRLSEVIAELLNPEGGHAQGRMFWDLFAQEFSLNRLMNYSDRVTVQTEVLTDALKGKEYRRIDILAVIGGAGNRALAIENKPWASDQNQQVTDYLSHLEKRYPNGYVLIYLSGDGSPPGNESINEAAREKAENDGRLRVIAFRELVAWLGQCRGQCKASKVSDFLQEFAGYIERQFMGIPDMTDRQAVIDAALMSPETLGAAMEVVSAGTDIREKLCGQLAQTIRRCLDESELRGVVSLRFQDGMEHDAKRWWDKWQGFSFLLNSELDRYGLRFQFEVGNFQDFYFGIKNGRNADEKTIGLPPPLLDVQEVLEREFGLSNRGDPKPWTWYVAFNNSLRNWDNEVEPWLHIQSGELAKKIIENVRRVYNLLKKANLLEKLRGIP